MLTKKYNTQNKQNNFAIKKARKIINRAKHFKKGAHKTWFVPKSINNGFIFSYGPQSEILFVMDNNKKYTESSLNKPELLFENAFDAVFVRHDKTVSNNRFLSFTEEFSYHSFIEAYDNIHELINDPENLFDIAFVFVLDASKNSNLECLPHTSFNTKNPKFFKNLNRDSESMKDYPGHYYVISSSCRPESIVGAFFCKSLACTLDIDYGTFIVNDSYSGNLKDINNKLNIKEIKNFKKYRLSNFFLKPVEEAYFSNPYGLDNIYQQIKTVLYDKINKNDWEKKFEDSQLFVNIKCVIKGSLSYLKRIEKTEQIIDRAKKQKEMIIRSDQFCPKQVEKIEQIISQGKKLKKMIMESDRLSFEQIEEITRMIKRIITQGKKRKQVFEERISSEQKDSLISENINLLANKIINFYKSEKFIGESHYENNEEEITRIAFY